ncbi:MAG: hypothetical protein KF686_02430 [Ramlibacter sp.]|nr:hypothetical protein [Ramlibacter sp.]
MPSSPAAAALLIAASAFVALLLGLVHLLYTFRGTKLHPRDPALRSAMQADTLQLTRSTTVWRAWVGFNASHSYGVILFGLVWAQLALVHPDFLLGSPFLLALGGALLAGYVQLAHRYWFRIPLGGMVLAGALYAAGLLALV